MTLKWEDQGNGSFYARDEVTGLSAQVEKSGIDPDKPFVWFIADLPVYPDPIDDPTDFADSEYSGSAATAEEAMAAAEDIIPDEELISEMRADAEAKWEAWHKARRDAADNN
jgi:hypothetical protein